MRYRISEKCGDQNAPSLNVPKEWIGVLHYSLTDTDVDNNTKGCPSVADRVRTALLFGASAIIILTLNPHILKELDVSQLFSQPVVVLENIDNITCLLSILISKIKVKAKILYNTSHYDLLNFSTLTLWATCGRALWATSDNIGGDFICLEQQGAQGKANPGDFWNFFYSGLCTLMLLLKLKTGQQNLAANSTDDGAECHVKKLAYQALSVIRIRRYTESDYSDDLCAVCLDQYQLRQKIRVLPCCHEFHTKCVDPWLIQCGTCPLCKQDITDKDNF